MPLLLLKQIRTGHRTPQKNNHVHTPWYHTFVKLSQKMYFLFQGKYYEMSNRAAMGSPSSPVLATLFMEEFETKAIDTAANPQRLLRR